MTIREMKINKSENQIIAENLRNLFKKNNVTESKVAQALNVPVMTIRRLLSGETIDPRVFTLKTVADYFNVTVDTLLEPNNTNFAELERNKPFFVPVLDWTTAEKIQSIQDIDLNKWETWQSISLGQNCVISNNTFALQSRPSMYPRFQQGTTFIIDPEVPPSDGDMVLIKILKNNELTLRELSIDPPEWQLIPIVPGSISLAYSSELYKIVGVVLLTLLYNKKIYNQPINL